MHYRRGSTATYNLFTYSSFLKMQPRFQQFDYYKQVVNMELMKTTVRLKSNPDYSGEEELAVERPKTEEYV